MTATETIDLFSFDTRRHRVVDWQAPGPVARRPPACPGVSPIPAGS